MVLIKFAGLKKLTSSEEETLQEISNSYAEKIERKLKNVSEITVHVKEYEKEGGKKKYSLRVRCSAPTKAIIDGCDSDDYDLARALHKSFEDIIQQISHKFHTDVTRPNKE